ncbi:hypothetical protein A5722_21715 [Mycobacterium vulneris]|nr:hypothetical protein A5722_21715 [Mycolicibacterium vulneris]OCB64888.1 hypothetical protein A5729_19280 [Mycolicibacterium vulneris]
MMVNWMWGSALTAFAGFIFAVAALGSTVFRSRHWAAAFREIAVWEVQRRGVIERKRSSTDDKAIDLMLGQDPVFEDSGSPFENLLRPTFSVLSGYGGNRDLATLIIGKREDLLAAALECQLRRAARFSTLRWASRAWIAQKSLSRVEVGLRGVVWLLPRAVKEVIAIVKEHSTAVGVVVVFAGSVFWTLVKNYEGADTSPSDIIGFLVKLVLPGLMLWALGVLLFRIVAAFAGPPKAWSRRAVITVGLTTMGSVGAAVALNAASKSLVPLEQNWLEQLDTHDPTVLRIAAACLSAGFLWLACRSARRALDRTRLMSYRIGVVSASFMLLAFSIPLAGMVVTGTVVAPLRTAMFTLFSIALALGLVSSACEVREWIDRYRRLVRDEVRVPRWGFSWWLIGGWFLAMSMVFVQTALPAGMQNSPLGVALVVPPMLAMLGLIPLAVTSVLFVRRVNTYFERHTAVRWPEL